MCSHSHSHDSHVTYLLTTLTLTLRRLWSGRILGTSFVGKIEQMGDDLIGSACKLLTTYKHCKLQAKRLSICKKKASKDNSFFSIQSNSCDREISSFQTCSREKLEAVIGDLTKVAAKFCPREVLKFQQCKARTMSQQACEMEDQRALECAARAVISSAKKT